MTRTLIFRLIAGLAPMCLLLTACGSPILEWNDMRKIHRNMSKDELRKSLPISTEKEYTVAAFGSNYEALQYRLHGGQQTTSSSSGFGSSRTTTTTTVNYIYDYIYVFGSDRLLYWGFISDFCKDDNPVVMEIGNALSSAK